MRDAENRGQCGNCYQIKTLYRFKTSEGASGLACADCAYEHGWYFDTAPAPSQPAPELVNRESPPRESVGEAFKRGWNEPVADSVYTFRKWLVIIGVILMVVCGMAYCAMWNAGWTG